MFGLGKERSKFGRFMDRHGVSQEDVVRVSKLNRDTVSKAFNEDNPSMRAITKKSLVNAARKLTGEDVSSRDFWRNI